MSPPEILAVGGEAALVLAVLHEAAFAPRRERPWSAGEIRDLLLLPGVSALLAGQDPPLGMVMVQVTAGEAEILTLAVDPEARRCGVGGLMLDHALRLARHQGALTMLLEVAEDNPPALALYNSRDFTPRGRRPRYYSRDDGSTADALILGRCLRDLKG
ncbi:GNAT family N-acetyltransferase [Pararhodospirillum photometricum]|uniref:GCN5-related N-acetyltransferase n=1 Tax=Pararhodospirillum photometricum DSM 122 TaxID=1150469 RepID=H6SS94_PARPM|nr:GNAT family N-acetyltransferase [Pararhodospirillum photometricum]CCG07773.1 GCN5-related N-acetyltransferase [Pararhodospirillum photometricum DSM 122]